MMDELNEVRVREWFESPVTQIFIARLENERKSIMERWAHGHYLADSTSIAQGSAVALAWALDAVEELKAEYLGQLETAEGGE